MTNEHILKFAHTDNFDHECEITVDMGAIDLTYDSPMGWRYLLNYSLEYQNSPIIQGYCKIYNVTSSSSHCGNHSDRGCDIVDAISEKLCFNPYFHKKFTVENRIKLIYDSMAINYNTELKVTNLIHEEWFMFSPSERMDIYSFTELDKTNDTSKPRMIAVLHAFKEPTEVGLVKIKVLAQKEIIPLLVRKKIDLSNFHTI